jgi:hypothetical protein
MWGDLASIDTRLDSRAVTFENPTGARGAGGQAANGRKGAPSRSIQPGETVVLADLDGPGTLRHIWMTFPPARPEQMRSLSLLVFYDGAAEPSCSVPCLDFFGLPHGRPAEYYSAVMTAHQGRGFNAYLPMPFRKHVRVEVTNGAPIPVPLYYQIDYTLAPAWNDAHGYLHVVFNRENPTTPRRDFTIAFGLHGPGRFLGCNVGVRPIDGGMWYGEGEVKVYRDGDAAFPTICGTGLEDYVGTGWGMDRHYGPFAGAPIDVREPQDEPPRLAALNGVPAFVGFYRWHIPDPIIFQHDLRVTIQQIGAAFFMPDQAAELAAYLGSNPPAGLGLARLGEMTGGIFERVDDYCATAYVYCREPQAVPRLDLAAALADIGRKPWEQASPFEAMFAAPGQSEP